MLCCHNRGLGKPSSYFYRYAIKLNNMSRIKEALLTDKYVDLWPDTTDADYQYEMWLEQQQQEEEYYTWLAKQNSNVTQG
jgi:hypothetical protein